MVWNNSLLWWIWFFLGGLCWPITLLAQSAFQEEARSYNHEQSLLRQGQAYLRAHRYEVGLEKLNQLLLKFPEHAQGHHLRGNAYYYLKQREPACTDWRKACDLGQCYGWTFATFERVCEDPS